MTRENLCAGDGPWAVDHLLNTGQRVSVRPLRSDDVSRLGDYLLSLSEETRRRWSPHGFDRDAAVAVCNGLGSDDVVRLVATTSADGDDQIIAYLLVKLGVRERESVRYAAYGIALDNDFDCTFAPSVADAYQNSGLGSRMLQHVKSVLRCIGRERVVLWGGVQETNLRGIHFYTKAGFVKVGEFYTDKNNWDMLVEL